MMDILKLINIDYDKITMEYEDLSPVCEREEPSDGLSAPFKRITCEGEGGKEDFCVWKGLPLVYMPSFSGRDVLTLKGEHYVVHGVKLSAFTDDNDTLVSTCKTNLFARKTFAPLYGDIFIIESMTGGDSVVLISETPDYVTTALTVAQGVVKISNEGYGLAVGFCAWGEEARLCREYYRHAKTFDSLFAMSNTWGDRNGYTRVCHDFVVKEIDNASEIGVDIVQIDDGWQKGNTDDLTLRDDRGRRFFPESFWEISQEKFPLGLKVISDYAAEKNVKAGLWFAPDSRDSFALAGRDAEILKRACLEWGFSHFKLDMYWIENKEHSKSFLGLLNSIHHYEKYATVQLDVTRNYRINYLYGREFGTIFVENRYTKWANYYPCRTLRNLWMLSRYIPPAKLQFEIVNPDLNSDYYEADDVYAPIGYDMDYLFASVMVSNPLFWMELQYLSAERKRELKRIMPLWKSLRSTLATADCEPIGDCPGGRGISGFCIRVEGKARYLLLLCDAISHKTAEIPCDTADAEIKILATNDESCRLSLKDKKINGEFCKQKSYVFAELI